MIIIADTTPLNYLVLIGHSSVLPLLYGRVLIPPAVYEELQAEGAPASVRDWAAQPPAWLETRQPSLPLSGELEALDPGECEAIALAMEMKADLLILDDRDARIEASRRKLTVIGTLRVLKMPHNLGSLICRTPCSGFSRQPFALPRNSSRQCWTAMRQERKSNIGDHLGPALALLLPTSAG